MTEKEKDTARISIELPANIKKDAIARAKSKGLTLSPYLRNLIIRDLELSKIKGLKQ